MKPDDLAFPPHFLIDDGLIDDGLIDGGHAAERALRLLIPPGFSQGGAR